VGDHSYLIRYGVMRHVGRFSALPVREGLLERGQLVVIQTDRGVELGEVLIALDDKSTPARDLPGKTTSGNNGEESTDSVSIDSSRVLRVAGADDLSLSKRAEELRSRRFMLCQQILREGNWPWELVDVEPLLDGRATVLHYLGPHQLDVAPLRARFRVECDLDVVLEPVGDDLESEHSASDAHDDGTGGGCGSCGCSDGGGCGSAPAPPPAGHRALPDPSVSGCDPKSHSGCSSCGISRLMAERSRTRD
jgi:PSP1 C-terminal conserved region